MSKQAAPKPHGSIPGYRPGPILTRNHKLLLWGLLIGPSIAYGFLKYREFRRVEEEKQLELEGRESWVRGHASQESTPP